MTKPDFGDLRAPRGRERDLENMVTHFRKLQNSLIIFTESEFSKYTPIYMAEYRKEVSEYTPSELEFIANLSKEFHSRIDLYKPTYVVSDQLTPIQKELQLSRTNHEQIFTAGEKLYIYFGNNILREVLFILPEIQQPFSSLKTTEAKEAVDICQNITANAHDQPWKVSEAVNNLAHHMFASQDMDQTVINGKNFMQHVIKLHNSKYFNTKITASGKLEYKQDNSVIPTINPTTTPIDKVDKKGDVSLDDLFD